MKPIGKREEKAKDLAKKILCEKIFKNIHVCVCVCVCVCVFVCVCLCKETDRKKNTTHPDENEERFRRRDRGTHTHVCVTDRETLARIRERFWERDLAKKL
jgi:hypothetical protein